MRIATLHYKYYYSFCIVKDVAPNYDHTKFGNNSKTPCGNMDKTVKKNCELEARNLPPVKDGFRQRISSRT